MGLRKCACIDTLFTELPWEHRFQAAKDAGFTHIEFWDWADKNLDELRDYANAAHIGISGFNGDGDYSLIDPSHKDKYLEHLEKSMLAAKKIDALSVTVHSNALDSKGIVVNHYNNLSDTVKLCSMYDTLLASVKLAEKIGIRMNLEALNVTTDHVGNFLKTSQMSAEICELIGSPMLKMLFDVYHFHLNEGSICDNLTKYKAQIGHVHVADAPGRHEPGTGELNYAHILRHLEDIGYDGLVGYELFPQTTTEQAIKAIMHGERYIYE